ncbi:MAG: DUF6285 domain-containing protein [Steroidobacteraceae bacterium]
MQDPPHSLELLDLVAEFLRNVAVPQLAGQSAFHARVAANAVDLIKRELQQSARSSDAEYVRLQSLLGPGALEDLNAQLSKAIASGEMTLSTPGLAEHLWATTLAKMSIDQPTYAAYQREQSQR